MNAALNRTATTTLVSFIDNAGGTIIKEYVGWVGVDQLQSLAVSCGYRPKKIRVTYKDWKRDRSRRLIIAL